MFIVFYFGGSQWQLKNLLSENATQKKTDVFLLPATLKKRGKVYIVPTLGYCIKILELSFYCNI